MLVHRTWLSQDSHYLLQTVRDQVGRRVFPVHRLDRATSGAIVFGFDPQAARRMAAAFQDKRVEKVYHAVVRGWLSEPLVIDYPLEDKETGVARKPAVTHVRELLRVELEYAVDRYPTARYALIEARPVTGRRHQIRKHLKHISHPIVGDTTYGKGSHNRFFRDRYGISRLLLTATRLGFVHPYTGRNEVITAFPDAEWQALISAWSVHWERCW